MKKSPQRPAAAKRRTASSADAPADAKAVATYLSRLPQPAKSTLQSVRAAILSACPKGTVEAIAYGIPTFKHNGNICAIAAFKAHCSLFPMSGFVLNKFHTKLSAYDVSKGTVRFPSNKPLPAPLVKKIVKARLAQMFEKRKSKSAL